MPDYEVSKYGGVENTLRKMSKDKENEHVLRCNRERHHEKKTTKRKKEKAAAEKRAAEEKAAEIAAISDDELDKALHIIAVFGSELQAERELDKRRERAKAQQGAQ